MAGKHYQHISGSTIEIAFRVPPYYPGTRMDRAYAEGRHAAAKGQPAIDNPFTFDQIEFSAWSQGWSRYAGVKGWQIQTADPKAPPPPP